MGGRPVLLQRFPQRRRRHSFFQKRVPKNAPEWLRDHGRVSTPNGTTSNALVVADLAHVVWAVNLGCLGFHVWPSHADDLEHADELRIDLDPQPGVDFADGARGRARGARRCSTSSASSATRRPPATAGIHVYVRLEPRRDSLRRCARPRSPSPASSSGAGPT